MSPQFVFFIASAVVINLLIVGALLARPLRAAREDVVSALDGPRPLLAEPATKDARADERAAQELGAFPGTSYRQTIRVLWWLLIAGALIGVGVSGAFVQNQPLIFGLGALAVVAAIFFHELSPASWRTGRLRMAEAAVALGLVTALLALTGHGASPFVLALQVLVVAVALGRGDHGAFVFTAATSLAYVGVLAIDPDRAAYGGGDLLGFGLHMGTMWLLTLVASVFAVQERRIRAQMLQMSQTDPLTGLLNRSQIHATVDSEVRRTRRSDRGFCLLMVDLDGLKAVNDSFGHHRGDAVLRSLGTVITRSIRTVDSAYRYGGDEFVILLPETDIVGAFVVAEKIRAQAEQIGERSDGDVVTSVSIGLVSHPEDGATVEELMIAADRAMYAAKGLGKNQISGSPRPRRRLQPAAPRAAAPPASASPSPSPLADVSSGPGGRAIAVAPGADADASGDEELGPAEARRRIAALSYDSEHQIGRAMDTLLGTPPRGGDRHDLRAS